MCCTSPEKLRANDDDKQQRRRRWRRGMIPQDEGSARSRWEILTRRGKRIRRAVRSTFPAKSSRFFHWRWYSNGTPISSVLYHPEWTKDFSPLVFSLFLSHSVSFPSHARSIEWWSLRIRNLWYVAPSFIIFIIFLSFHLLSYAESKI